MKELSDRGKGRNGDWNSERQVRDRLQGSGTNSELLAVIQVQWDCESERATACSPPEFKYFATEGVRAARHIPLHQEAGLCWFW